MANNISCIIVDDENHCIEILKHELKNHCPDITVAAVTTKPTEAISLIQKHKPQILFLDIEMPSLSGFDLLASIDDGFFSVIFVTAYDQYAIQAFKFAALDYLLKPVDGTELKRAVDKHIKNTDSSLRKDQLSLVLNSINQKQQLIPKIALNNGNKIEIVNIGQIIRCEADSNYCKIYLTDERELYLTKTLKDIESLLSNHPFLRVHNKHLVNINHVQNFIKSEGGVLTMSDGFEVHVTKFNKKELIQKIISG